MFDNIKEFFGMNQPQPEVKLSPNNIKHAYEWYQMNHKYINDMVKIATKSYPPEDPENYDYPQLWSPENWNWFKKTQKDLEL